MFSLLIYERYVEFWRDMWLILLEPISDLPPQPSCFDQGNSLDPEATPPK